MQTLAKVEVQMWRYRGKGREIVLIPLEFSKKHHFQDCTLLLLLLLLCSTKILWCFTLKSLGDPTSQHLIVLLQKKKTKQFFYDLRKRVKVQDFIFTFALLHMRY